MANALAFVRKRSTHLKHVKALLEGKGVLLYTVNAVVLKIVTFC